MGWYIFQRPILGLSHGMCSLKWCRDLTWQGALRAPFNSLLFLLSSHLVRFPWENTHAENSLGENQVSQLCPSGAQTQLVSNFRWHGKNSSVIPQCCLFEETAALTNRLASSAATRPDLPSSRLAMTYNAASSAFLVRPGTPCQRHAVQRRCQRGRRQPDPKRFTGEAVRT